LATRLGLAQNDSQYELSHLIEQTLGKLE
jgi:hypothetical protein